MAAIRTGPSHQRLTADEIRAYEPPTKFGRPDPDAVRHFRDLVAAEVELLTQERQNAHRFPAAEAAAREATHILLHARRTGENVVRDAQFQARQVSEAAQERWDHLLADGQSQREAMLVRARSQADAIVAEAAARFPADAQAQVAFLDSFAELLTSQLRSSIEVLERRRPGAQPPGA